MLAAELVAARENASIALLAEIEPYIQAVLDANTANAAKQLPKPLILHKLSKPGELADAQRSARGLAARLLYLRALKPGTAIMPVAALSRVKSQAWQNWNKFDLGIVLATSCPACEALAELTVRNVHDSSAYKFNCPACGHHYRGAMGKSESEVDCACRTCVERKNELLTEIIQIIEASTGSMKQRFDDWRKMLDAEVEEWPSALDMERDYKLNRDNVGKDIRAILSFRPADPNDFEACLERFLQSHRGKRSDILEKALRQKVLYSRESPDVPAWASAVGLMAEAGKDTPYTVSGERRWGCGSLGEKRGFTALAAILDRKMTASELLIDAGRITILQRTQSEWGNELASFRLLASEGEREGLLDGEIPYRWRSETILNPYFTGAAKPPEIQEEQGTGRASPLFNSTTEGQAYLRIASENPGCIVVPNRLLKRIVDLNQFKPALESDEFRYANSAEIDFAVYDEQGRLLFVEEQQRGDHHNQATWIWKDAVKRKVLRLAGISFREASDPGVPCVPVTESASIDPAAASSSLEPPHCKVSTSRHMSTITLRAPLCASMSPFMPQ